MKVSIITPTYNSKKFIESTANSVLNQTFKDWEWIIVDDLSKDGTREYLKTLQNKDTRIKCYFLDQNIGSGPARNKAIELASGTYLAFLDSDDIWIDTKLEIQVDFMEKNNYAFSHTSHGFIDEHEEKVRKTFHVSNIPVTYSMLLKKNEIGCLTAMFNQKIIGKMYMPDLRRKQDYALWLSILRKGYQSYPLDIETAFYRLHANSATSSKLNLIGKHWLFLKEYEKMNWVNSTFYTICWGLNGILKHYISPFRTRISKL